MCLVSLQNWCQAVQFQMGWMREQEDAGSQSCAGFIAGISEHSHGHCLSFSARCPRHSNPWSSVLILLGLCSGGFTLQRGAVGIGPVPALNWKHGAKQLWKMCLGCPQPIPIPWDTGSHSAPPAQRVPRSPGPFTPPCTSMEYRRNTNISYSKHY